MTPQTHNPDAPAAAPRHPLRRAVERQLPAAVTAEMVAAGQAQWTGGAICTACHGPDANAHRLPRACVRRVAERHGWHLRAERGVINTGVAQPRRSRV